MEDRGTHHHNEPPPPLPRISTDENEEGDVDDATLDAMERELELEELICVTQLLGETEQKLKASEDQVAELSQALEHEVHARKEAEDRLNKALKLGDTEQKLHETQLVSLRALLHEQQKEHQDQMARLERLHQAEQSQSAARISTLQQQLSVATSAALRPSQGRDAAASGNAAPFDRLTNLFDAAMACTSRRDCLALQEQINDALSKVLTPSQPASEHSVALTRCSLLAVKLVAHLESRAGSSVVPAAAAMLAKGHPDMCRLLVDSDLFACFRDAMAAHGLHARFQAWCLANALEHRPSSGEEPPPPPFPRRFVVSENQWLVICSDMSSLILACCQATPAFASNEAFLREAVGCPGFIDCLASLSEMAANETQRTDTSTEDVALPTPSHVHDQWQGNDQPGDSLRNNVLNALSVLARAGTQQQGIHASLLDSSIVDSLCQLLAVEHLRTRVVGVLFDIGYNVTGAKAIADRGGAAFVLDALHRATDVDFKSSQVDGDELEQLLSLVCRLSQIDSFSTQLGACDIWAVLERLASLLDKHKSLTVGHQAALADIMANLVLYKADADHEAVSRTLGRHYAVVLRTATKPHDPLLSRVLDALNSTMQYYPQYAKWIDLSCFANLTKLVAQQTQRDFLLYKTCFLVANCMSSTSLDPFCFLHGSVTPLLSRIVETHSNEVQQHIARGLANYTQRLRHIDWEVMSGDRCPTSDVMASSLRNAIILMRNSNSHAWAGLAAEAVVRYSWLALKVTSTLNELVVDSMDACVPALENHLPSERTLALLEEIDNDQLLLKLLPVFVHCCCAELPPVLSSSSGTGCTSSASTSDHDPASVRVVWPLKAFEFNSLEEKLNHKATLAGLQSLGCRLSRAFASSGGPEESSSARIKAMEQSGLLACLFALAYNFGIPERTEVLDVVLIMSPRSSVGSGQDCSQEQSTVITAMLNAGGLAVVAWAMGIDNELFMRASSVLMSAIEVSPAIATSALSQAGVVAYLQILSSSSDDAVKAAVAEQLPKVFRHSDEECIKLSSGVACANLLSLVELHPTNIELATGLELIRLLCRVDQAVFNLVEEGVFRALLEARRHAMHLQLDDARSVDEKVSVAAIDETFLHLLRKRHSVVAAIVDADAYSLWVTVMKELATSTVPIVTISVLDVVDELCHSAAAFGLLKADGHETLCDLYRLHGVGSKQWGATDFQIVRDGSARALANMPWYASLGARTGRDTHRGPRAGNEQSFEPSSAEQQDQVGRVLGTTVAVQAIAHAVQIETSRYEAALEDLARQSAYPSPPESSDEDEDDDEGAGDTSTKAGSGVPPGLDFDDSTRRHALWAITQCVMSTPSSQWRAMFIRAGAMPCLLQINESNASTELQRYARLSLSHLVAADGEELSIRIAVLRAHLQHHKNISQLWEDLAQLHDRTRAATAESVGAPLPGQGDESSQPRRITDTTASDAPAQE